MSNFKPVITDFIEVETLQEDHGVYMVQHRKTGDLYIKKILGFYNTSVYRFLMEHHVPHTPEIYLMEENAETETLTIIEEYIPGKTLEEILDKSGVLPEKDVISIGLKLTEILDNLQKLPSPVIHRDIKPSNLIINDQGELFLIDFNAAKFFDSDEAKASDTVLLGTHGYAAPEQYGFGISGKATDIYAVGILLNQLLTGNLDELCSRNCRLYNVISKCLKLNPKERYKSMKALNRAISSLDWHRLLPPGFRKRNPINMLIGFIGYLLIFFLAVNLELNDASAPQLWFNRVSVLIVCLLIVMLISNYKDVYRFIPGSGSENTAVRAFAITVAAAASFIGLFCIMVIVEHLVFQP